MAIPCIGYRAGSHFKEHPHWAAGWMAKGHGPLEAERYWLTPVEMEVRSFLGALAEELATSYDIDGIHLDYIRYPEPQNRDLAMNPSPKEIPGGDGMVHRALSRATTSLRGGISGGPASDGLLRQIRTRHVPVDSGLLFPLPSPGVPFKSYPGLCSHGRIGLVRAWWTFWFK